jgi:hypothetical protein
MELIISISDTSLATKRYTQIVFELDRKLTGEQLREVRQAVKEVVKGRLREWGYKREE